MTPQRIRLKTIRLKNLDALSDHSCVISVYSRGVTVAISPGAANVTISAGETLEIINDDATIMLDQGSLILGTPDADEYIEFIIDGEEDYAMETR